MRNILCHSVRKVDNHWANQPRMTLACSVLRIPGIGSAPPAFYSPAQAFLGRGVGRRGAASLRGVMVPRGHLAAQVLVSAHRKNVERRWLLENMDGAFLVLDEIVDGG